METDLKRQVVIGIMYVIKNTPTAAQGKTLSWKRSGAINWME